jgi:hypothetical protein
MRLHMTDVLLRRIAILLVFLMASISFVPQLEAAFVPSEESLSTHIRMEDMSTVQKILEHKLVGERLKALGYSEAEVKDRLDQLSDNELHRFATQLNNLAPGGGLGGVIFGIVFIVAIVLAILYLTGKRIVIH